MTPTALNKGITDWPLILAKENTKIHVVHFPAQQLRVFGREQVLRLGEIWLSFAGKDHANKRSNVCVIWIEKYKGQDF